MSSKSVFQMPEIKTYVLFLPHLKQQQNETNCKYHYGQYFRYARYA
jgi:hypothetical protein